MKRYILYSTGIVFIIILIIFTISSLLGYKQEISEKSIVSQVEKSEESLAKNGVTNIASGIIPQYTKLDILYYYNEEFCLSQYEKAISEFPTQISSKNTNRFSKLTKEKRQEFAALAGDIKLPLLIFRGSSELYDYAGNYNGNSDTFTAMSYGIGACSQKNIIYNICRYLKNKPDLCRFDINEKTVESSELSTVEDPCYECCFLNLNKDNLIINEYHCGSPCDRISGYVEGRSKIASRKCYNPESCSTSANDIACCKEEECVDESACYALSDVHDVEGDSHKEICLEISGNSLWTNPDIDESACLKAGVWMPNERYCCGDDSDEAFVSCTGEICKEDDKACCTKKSCVYNGNCYTDGCTTLKLYIGETKQIYCDGDTGKWIGLDDAEDYCKKCVSRDAWSGAGCCGDESNEGKYYNSLIIIEKNETKNLNYIACSIQSTDCVHPSYEVSLGEGCYTFKDEEPYLPGGYYCDKGKWYILNSSEEYCKKCGFQWNNGKCNLIKLCGNSRLDRNEECEPPETQENPSCKEIPAQCMDKKTGTRNKYGNCNSNCLCESDMFQYSCVKGRCSAECSSNTDCNNGETCNKETCECSPTGYCGDNLVQRLKSENRSEECELPNTFNNTYCTSLPDICYGRRSAFSDVFGSCEDNCQCEYTNLDYICIKGRCNAECNNDGSGCAFGKSCDIANCLCTESESVSVCGDGICSSEEGYLCSADCSVNCPYRIEMAFDKKRYYSNQAVYLHVDIYDKNKKKLPNILFSLDIIREKWLVSSTSLSTNAEGKFTKIDRFVNDGIYKYIASTNIRGCGQVTASSVVNVSQSNELNLSSLNSSLILIRTLTPDIVNETILTNKCGNDILETGEVCEGNKECRASLGCDYTTLKYDLPELCSKCDCPVDGWSIKSDSSYCTNCNHCGDGVINCGESCENGSIYVGLSCKDGRLYNRTDTCINCEWIDEVDISDVLISQCQCFCPSNPEINCINGNFIDYPEKYGAGCIGNSCNECNCLDNYSKDSNNDGIEDRCSPEVCSNSIDDNNNGLIDEAGCIFYYCSQCGSGIFNACDRDECLNLPERCFFSEVLYGGGDCYSCSQIQDCAEYWRDYQSCVNDPCLLQNCLWNNNNCCTDNNKDSICDSNEMT